MSKSLRAEQKYLIFRSKSLLCDYDDWVNYFRKYGGRAEYQYYLEQLQESGYESEGYFSLHHETLRAKIRQNRNERKVIAVRLKQIKKLLK